MIRETVARIVAAVTLLAGLAGCEREPEAPPPLKLYVLDCGRLMLDDVSMFGLENSETPVRELFVPCYLIEHSKGRLLWDGGLPLSAAGKGEIEVRPGAKMVYERSLVDQLAELELSPLDINLVAFSHFHFDHVGAANLFPHAELLIQRAEHDAAFADSPLEIFDPRLYDKLRDAPKRFLDGDVDVFGDGHVAIISAPGHTPGHQVLLLNLKQFGPLVLSGDLYHFAESRELRRVPEFNVDPEQTLASMDKVESLIESLNATLWIEHELALAQGLKKSPQFYQ